MQVAVKLFAAARQLAAADEALVNLPSESTIADLRAALVLQHPPLATLLRHALFAIDAEYVTDAAPISESAEIACIPPVSGG